MCFLRVEDGYYLINKKWNEDIWKELHITYIITRIEDYETKWLEHVGKDETEENPKKSFSNVIQQ